mmetsp:Transcript_23691/g.66444  ORF Transcript_23691/g.66444 Transcript_23691/m.66444 type:complete len:278 (+) Transcript_23691:31-864(+)
MEVKEGVDVLFGTKNESSNTYSSWSLAIPREYTYYLKDGRRKIQVLQNDQGKGELGSRLWAGGILFSDCLGVEKYFGVDYWRDKRVIEVGSGCGITGLVCSLHGANVLVTDKSVLVPLMRENALRNGFGVVHDDGLANDVTLPPTEGNWETVHNGRTVRVGGLEWGANIASRHKHQYDVVLGCDVIYEVEGVDLLLATIAQLLRDDTSVAYISYAEPRYACSFFLERATQTFESVRVLSMVDDFGLSTEKCGKLTYFVDDNSVEGCKVIVLQRTRKK